MNKLHVKLNIFLPVQVGSIFYETGEAVAPKQVLAIAVWSVSL